MPVKSTTTKMIITITSILKKVLVITSIANTTATAKIITSITKSMYMQSAEKAVAAIPISLASKTVAGQH